MDKIKIYRERKRNLEKGKEGVKTSLNELFDEDSFVELGSFAYSNSEFFEEEGAGEGVTTGFATMDGSPYYVIAQNFAERFGGMTKENCAKIVRILHEAEKNRVPVVWLLSSRGVRIREGAETLEGIASVLSVSANLKGKVAQFALVMGETYGASAAIAAGADFIFFLKESALAVTSPLVLSAKAGKNLKKEEVGGYRSFAHAALPAVEAESLGEVALSIRKISGLLERRVTEAELNEPAPGLNEEANAQSISRLFEESVEIGGNSFPEIKTYLCRLGGISAAAAVFDGVMLNPSNLKKITEFVSFARSFRLPLVLFADCLGIEPALSVNDSVLLREIGEYMREIGRTDFAKISVVFGRAIGLGYSLFAAKSAGFDYTCALATAEISLFESKQGAQIVYPGAAESDVERYSREFADPVHAARGGYLDDIVEPQYVKQYLIAALQMLLR